MHHVSYYVGIPESGKTTLARRRTADDIGATGYPAIIIDSMLAGNLADIPAATDPSQVVERVWGQGLHTRFHPQNEHDVETVFRAVQGGRRCILLIDEFSRWASNVYLPEIMEEVLRTYRHLNVIVHATTQYPGDLHRIARQCASQVYAFRCVSVGACKVLADEWGFDAEKVRAQRQGEFLTWARADGFKSNS